MANARPDRPTSFEEGATEGEEDDNDNDINKSSLKDESFISNNKQNGVPPVRNVDRYGFMGGDQYTSPEEIPKLTLDVIRKREVKWVEMFENWEKWMTKRFKRVRARCRKGIPPSLRARAWQYLCGSKFLMDQNQGKFEEYLHKSGDPKWIEDIHKDLHRQFPLHEIFALRGGHGQEDLFRILKAYTIHNPQDGYCQAQGPIAAVLLMHMPAEQAFWCLVSICEKYLPGYYSPGLEAVHIDGDVLFGLLKKSSPLIYKHLKKQKIEPILYMTEWFMCVFSRTLPWTAVLRVWDMFFCEGVKVMFRIALVLFKLTLGTPEKLAECPTLYETMEKLRHIPHELIEGDFISKESLKLNVDEKDMEKEHQYQITKRRNLREKAQSSAKTEIHGSKKKRKQLGHVPEEKKPDSNSHLTFWKLQNKLLIKEPPIENGAKTTVSKAVKDEHILLQSAALVPKNEFESSKNLLTPKMQEMEMAKILAKEAFTAKVQQTLKPLLSDAQLSVEVDGLLTSDTFRKSSAEAIVQQTPAFVEQLAQNSSNEQPSLVAGNESLSSQVKGLYISSDMPTTNKKVLSESFGENQQVELKRMHSTEENQLQQPIEGSKQQTKLQMNFVNTDVQSMYSGHQKDEKAEIQKINSATAAKLESGQVLICPKAPTWSQSLVSSQKTENGHSYSSSQLACQLKPSGIITTDTPPLVEMQTLDICDSERPSISRHFMQKTVPDSICLDKTQYPNLTIPTCPNEFYRSSEIISSGTAVEPLLVKTLIKPICLVESQQIHQSIADKVSNDTNRAEQVESFEDQMSLHIGMAAETIASVPQQISPVLLETLSDELQPLRQLPVAHLMSSKESDDIDFSSVNIDKRLESNNQIADSEIKTIDTLAHQNWNPNHAVPRQLITSEQALHSQKVKLKDSFSTSEQIQSSRPLSTEVFKVKLSSLQPGFNSLSSEFTKLPSDTIVVRKQSVPPVKSLLINTECPLQLTEIMSVRQKQHLTSATEASSAKPWHLNLVLSKENPESEENMPLYCLESIHNQNSEMEEDSKSATVNLVDERTENSSNSIKHTIITEQLSFQTIQLSNKDDKLISAGAETNLLSKNNAQQIKETHI